LLTETDSKTMAFVNLFAVLGTLENLCELVPEARELLRGKEPISVGFAVKDGPSATLTFRDGGCSITEGCESCSIKLSFSSCDKFNGMIDGTVKPVPTKGFTKISFLTKTFVPLTELLSRYLKPSKEDMEDGTFREINTKLTLYAAAAAVAQIGNNDKSGRFSAGLMPDGDIVLEIKDVMGVTVNVKDHRLTTIKKPSNNPRAVLSFSDLEIARQLLNGEVSSIACICDGSVQMRGMLNMIDNLNRILYRVGQYLS